MITNQNAIIQNLERQVGQLAGQSSSRLPGALPSYTDPNPKGKGKEEVNAITLRSGKVTSGLGDATQRQPREGSHEDVEREDQEKRHEEDSVKEKEETTTPPDVELRRSRDDPSIHPPVPFPQRLQGKKEDVKFEKFLEMFKKLTITVPFADALEDSPIYALFMREILSKKRRLRDHEMIALTGECSALLMQELPLKMKDPGSLSIPCAIGEVEFEKALCDLGASVNLMPYDLKRLGIGELKPTTVTLQLADRSIAHPRGVVEDVIVRVGEMFFPADF
jgi:hypothetical protein